jgi:hypothetical protein
MKTSLFRKSDRRDGKRTNRRRLRLESLERRALLAAFAPMTNEQLIEDITTANGNGESDTIDLGGSTFTLSSVDNDEDRGANGLPIISPDGGNSLTIENGTIERDDIDSPAFRIIEIALGADLTIDNVTIRNGDSDRFGGGIFNNNGTLTVANSTVEGNAAGSGGGISTLFGTLTVYNSTLAGNSATGPGGGIYNNGATLTVSNSTLAGNSATSSGGGVFSVTGTLTVSNSTLADNSAIGGSGGGILNTTDGTSTVTNSTLSGNSVSGLGSGGGILNGGAGMLIVSNSTLAYNDSAGSNLGGGISNSIGTVTLYNTIVTGGTGGSCRNVSGVVTGSNNLSDGSCPGTIADVTDLGPLGDNGGPTLTHALLEGSNAIDAGNNVLAVDPNGDPLINDQRGSGFARVVNETVDIGSYEVQTTQLPEDQVAELIAYIQDDLDLPDGFERSLTATLDNALKKLTDTNLENDGAAVNSLEAVINKLEAQRGKKISEADADELIEQLQSIIDELTL